VVGWCVSVTLACLTGTYSMYAPLAAVVGGITAAAGWSSPQPRPDQSLKFAVCLNISIRYQIHPSFCSI